MAVKDFEVIKLKVPSDCHVLSESGLSFVAELKLIISERYGISLDSDDLQLEKEPDEYPVLLFVPGDPASDQSKSSKVWESDLEKKFFLKDFHARVQEFRKLLIVLKLSGIKSIFAFDQNCLDMGFEIAMACRYRFAFNLLSLLGSSESEREIFGPGIFFESLSSGQPKRKNFWKDNRIVPVQSALSAGFIDFLTDMSDWHSWLDGWISRHHATDRLFSSLGEGAKYFTKKEKKKRSLDKSNNTQEGMSTDRTSFDLAEQYEIISRRPRSFSDFMEFIESGSSKDFFYNDQERTSLLDHFIAQQYFEKSYLLNYRRGLAVSSALNKFSLKGNLDEPINNSVCLNLDFLIPPLVVVVSLLGCGREITFTASEGGRLQAGLERYFIGLAKHFGADLAQKYWQKQVSWFVGSGDSLEKPLVSWQFDDRLQISEKGKGYEVFSVAGNMFKAEFGVCELNTEISSSGDFYEHQLQLLRCLFSGVISVDYISGNSIPVSTWLRSVFFDELLRVSDYSDLNLMEVLAALKDTGWGYAADENNWARFLQTRYSSWPSLDNDDDFIGRFGPHQKSWDLASWKQAKLISLNNKAEVKNETWNQTIVSQHLATFCGLLAGVVFKEKKVLSSEQASLLCASSLGFPSKMGDPSGYVENRGIKRVKLYTLKFWPKYYQALFG